MTNEEKELVLKDLCARIFYGVICDRWGRERKLISVDNCGKLCLRDDFYSPQEYSVRDVKPYLHPMSSMTKEEREEYQTFFPLLPRDLMTPNDAIKMIDWLNAHHFDYRNLIEKGLALEAPKGMYEETLLRTTTSHDYINPEILSLLIEKGFDCDSHVIITQALVMKWLREEKDIYITIDHGDYPAQKKHFFMPKIETLDAVHGVDDDDLCKEFDKYEDAALAAIKYCLINMI